MRNLGRKMAALLCVLIVGTSMTAWAEELGPAFRNGQQITVNSDTLMRVGEKKADAQQEVKAEEAKETEKTADTVKAQEGDTPFGTVVTEESKLYQKGESLGEFKIVAYYGEGKTYSGTTPTENHTIAADLSVLPLGTKVFVGDTVYTVEDKGSSVVGNMIDIYYDTKEEAVGVTKSGRKFAEVFTAVKK